jgi:hypothetical protein
LCRQRLHNCRSTGYMRPAVRTAVGSGTAALPGSSYRSIVAIARSSALEKESVRAVRDALLRHSRHCRHVGSSHSAPYVTTAIGVCTLCTLWAPERVVCGSDPAGFSIFSPVPTVSGGGNAVRVPPRARVFPVQGPVGR